VGAVTNVRIVINDTVEFDGPVDDWEHRPPDAFKDVIKPGADPKPWLKAILVTMAEAVMKRESMTIIHRSNRWSMMVEYV
jgi:hypothetical protein